MNSHETIRTEVTEDAIGVVTLNRPDKRNALSIKMRSEISACLDVWKAAESVRLVVFTGEGPVFCAGFDLNEFRDPTCYPRLYETSARYHRDVWYYSKPTLAAINGPALGGGFDLTTLCDVRICSETAQFGHPEIKFGAPPLFSPLRWIVGSGLARDLCLSGRRIDAAEALRSHLVSEVVPAADLRMRALAVAKSILEAPDQALRMTKAYMAGASSNEFESSFRVEHDQVFQETLLKGMAPTRS
ncbi:MAG: enoyl-CoA hydratase/isomerase family protein [Nitrospirae bacterium]|nr:enoyl-CoA hydratase/isomerase family protein [Nitrospirota bacterium]